VTRVGTDADDLLVGGDFDDTLSGENGNDTLEGRDGNDLLNGGAGADRMEGGAGNDTYVVDDAADIAFDVDEDGSYDIVESSVSYWAANIHVEALTLTGSSPINGIGNSADNVLTGNDAANVLNGWSGADEMIGGRGDDSYVVDDAGDAAVEDFDGGIDTVFASVSHQLDAYVENLVLTGSGSTHGIGNSGNNVLTGNRGWNILNGGGGDDTLEGGGGRDMLVGGVDADTFVFNAHASSDIILDFEDGLDKIDLSGVAGVHGIEDLVLTDTATGIEVGYVTGSFRIADISDLSTIDAGDFIFA
jgi:Ca2+-binding RTX toxin-like protein